jgi:tRNA 2-thiouridine synthesizing protein A
VTRQRRAASAASAAAASAAAASAGAASAGAASARAAGAPGSGPGGRFPARIPGTAQPPALTLDALGKKCPIPIIMLADKIREIPVGQTIEVLADDPAAKSDLPAWCALKSQEFVSAADLPVGWSFLVRRSY